MKTIETLKPLTPALALAIALVLPAGVSAQQPQIELFPSTVIEDLREAGQAAEDFETDMMPAITEPEKEMVEYDKLKCGGAVGVENRAQQTFEGFGFKGRMSQRFQDYRTLVSSQAHCDGPL